MVRPSPRVPVALPNFSCQTTCLSAFVLLFEIVSTPVFFVLGHLTAVHSAMFYVSGVLSLLSISCGVLVSITKCQVCSCVYWRMVCLLSGLSLCITIYRV